MAKKDEDMVSVMSAVKNAQQLCIHMQHKSVNPKTQSSTIPRSSLSWQITSIIFCVPRM